MAAEEKEPSIVAVTRGVDLESRRAEEYQMQLFGFHSRTVYAAIKQKVKEHVDTRCQKIQSSIEKKYKPDEKGLETLNKNIKELRKAYRHNMQPHLIAIEKIINKFICVPNNVLLEEDKLQATQYNDDEFSNLERKLQSLQQQAKRVTVFNAALKEELEVARKIKEPEDLARKLCNIIDKCSSGKKLNSTNLRAMEKCKALTEALDSVKPPMAKDNYNIELDKDDLEQIFI